MKSSRPYLLRGLYQWMIENDATPHLLVDETRPGVMVPPGYGKDGMVILNLAPSAVQGLQLDNGSVSFEARFGGVPHQIYVPMSAIKGLFARENGEGMQFLAEPGDPPEDEEGVSVQSSEAPPQTEPAKGRPGLRVVR